MNLSERDAPWLIFNHVARYFGDISPNNDNMRKSITIWISTKSDGITLKTEDWEQLVIPDAGYPSGNDWTFISSTPINLAKYSGQPNVRIAFKYLSLAIDNVAGSWEIKNFHVYEE
jgi:hypothetical protein